MFQAFGGGGDSGDPKSKNYSLLQAIGCHVVKVGDGSHSMKIRQPLHLQSQFRFVAPGAKIPHSTQANKTFVAG